MECYMCGGERPALFKCEKWVLEDKCSHDNCKVYTVFRMLVCPECCAILNSPKKNPLNEADS